MPRIPPATPKPLDLGSQADQDQAQAVPPLPSAGIYAYAPAIQAGARALDAGITAAGRVPQQLRRLMNLRVASIVGCPF